MQRTEDTAKNVTSARAGGRGLVRRAAHGLAVAATAAAFAGTASLGIATLHVRAASEPPPAAAAAVSVATTRLALVDGYSSTTSFTGRLEPARQTALAFERGGLVVAVGPDEGQPVRAGEVVARLDTAQLRAGRGQLEARRRELEVQRNLAELTLGRQSKLRTQGWSPDQRLDEAEATVAQLSAAIDQVAAQIAGIDIDLAKSELKAPFDGHVAARAIDEGAVVAAGTPALTVLETGRRQARIGLPPDAARSLQAGRDYTIRAGRQALPARLAATRRDLETATRTVTVLLDVAGDAGDHSLGDLVTLDVETRVDARGAWVPLTALKEGRRGLWTIVVVDEADGKAVVRQEAVEVLHADADQAFVRGTIRNGDRVLTVGTDRVVAGQRVALAGK